jgi:hypothetical protein
MLWPVPLDGTCPMPNPCPVKGCARTRASAHLACRPHWFALPKDIRAAVWAGYRQGVMSDAYRAAYDDAREWWANNP